MIASAPIVASELRAHHRPLEAAEPLLLVAGPFAASADALSAWVMNAGEGRQCVYARAALCPRGVGAMARQLMAQGLVTLRRHRHHGDDGQFSEVFDFKARRTALRFVDARPVATGDRLPLEDRLLLDLLVDLADREQPVPCNSDLAARIGVRGGNRVSKQLARLAHFNLIRVHHPEPMGPGIALRRVEILETGAMTGAA